MILDNAEEQLAEWIPEKYGWKRNPHRALMRMYKFVGYIIFGKRQWNSDKPSMELGIDEFRRSVLEGMRIYVDILKRRGIKLNAVLVQGSRAKGKWKPTSDIDVTIIADNLPKKKHYPWPLNKLFGLKRWLLLSDIPLCMGVEATFTCSKNHFSQMLENFDIHALDAMYYGKLIYDDGFWKETRNRFEKINMKYELDKTDLKKMLFIL